MNSKMRLAARPMAGVAAVLIGFVDHPQFIGPEGLSQLVRDGVSNTHSF